MTLVAIPRTDHDTSISTDDLSLVVRRVASHPQLWRPRLSFRSQQRWTRLPGPDGVAVWLATWLPSQTTGLHDHGDAAGSYLDGIGETDLAKLGAVEWVTFLRKIIDTFGKSLAERLDRAA